MFVSAGKCTYRASVSCQQTRKKREIEKRRPRVPRLVAVCHSEAKNDRDGADGCGEVCVLLRIGTAVEALQTPLLRSSLLQSSKFSYSANSGEVLNRRDETRLGVSAVIIYIHVPSSLGLRSEETTSCVAGRAEGYCKCDQ